MYDLLILGGGASGIMASIAAKRKNNNLKIAILEHNDTLGKKILVSGSGRCNITNKNIETSSFYNPDKKLINAVFAQFDSKKIMNFFEEMGIDLYEEQKGFLSKGKVFPKTNDARTVLAILKKELERLEVDVLCDYEIGSVEWNQKFIVRSDEKDFESKKIIVALGGCSYPILGATKTGYAIAESLGHKVSMLFPSGVPVLVDNKYLSQASGVRVEASLLCMLDNDRIQESSGELLITDYGLSGPPILDISRNIAHLLSSKKSKKVTLLINFFPGENYDSLYDKLKNKTEMRPDVEIKYILYGSLPIKFVKTLLKIVDIDGEKYSSDLSKEEFRKIIRNLISLRVEVKGTRGWEQAEFTSGGVLAKEIYDFSLESKIRPGLYFAGEVIDVDGKIGGFNLAWAWASGFVAGTHASK